MDLDRPSGSLTTEVGACSVWICVYALYEHAVGWNSRRGRRDQRDKRVFFSLAAWTAVDGAKAAWTVPTLCIGSPDVLRSGGTGCEGAVRQRHGVQRAASFLRSCTPRRSPRAAPLLPPKQNSVAPASRRAVRHWWQCYVRRCGSGLAPLLALPHTFTLLHTQKHTTHTRTHKHTNTDRGCCGGYQPRRLRPGSRHRQARAAAAGAPAVRLEQERCAGIRVCVCGCKVRSSQVKSSVCVCLCVCIVAALHCVCCKCCR